MADDEDNKASLLMTAVEAAAISPQAARVLVEQYETQFRKKSPGASDARVAEVVSQKIISRYAKMASLSGSATSLSGVIPGVGTAVALVGGSLADLTICMKLQIDMTMCLAMAINKKLSDEDAKHMSFVIALTGSLEQAATKGGAEFASKAAIRVVNEHLKGATLVTVKMLFRNVGIVFTKKALVKTIPFGIGMVIGGTTNYYLTRYVGHLARDIFTLASREDEPDTSNDTSVVLSEELLATASEEETVAMHALQPEEPQQNA